MKSMSVNEIIPGSEVVELLERCNLLTADISESTTQHFFSLRQGNVLCATVGLELFGSDGLLRSLAVIPEMRGLGYAGVLVAHAEAFAEENGVRSLFLLTNTAAPVFAHFGYKVFQRSQAPASICQTEQFSGLCDASSDFMAKQLVSN
jgi:amino-acid N-acetyltransferase